MCEDRKRWRLPEFCGLVRFGKDVSVSVLPAHLLGCLHRVYARDVCVHGNVVTFTADTSINVSRWNALRPFDSGKLEVDPSTRQIRYRLSLFHLTKVVTVAVGSFGVVALVVFGCTGILLSKPVFVVTFVLSLASIGGFGVGLSLAIGSVRFPNFLRRSIADAPRGGDGRRTPEGRLGGS